MSEQTGKPVPDPCEGKPARELGEPVIVCENVVKRFDGRTVLDGVNLSIRKGETMVIMGGSGSGKSTMLRLIIGSLKPDSGRVLMFGEDIGRASPAVLNEVRKKFGILFQSGALFNSMTLAQNVALPIQEHTDATSSTSATR